MLTFNVIPFLLAVVMPDNKTSNEPEYIFDVRMETSFYEESRGMDKINRNNLFIILKCRPLMSLKLKCVIEQVGHYYTPNIDMEYNILNMYTMPDIIYDEIPSIITFSITGQQHYYIDMEDNKDKMFLLDVYHMIGDQLNIGTNITSKGVYFTDEDSSFIGLCPTFYQIYRLPIDNTSHYILQQEFHTLGDEDLKLTPLGTLHISKYRHLKQCAPLRDYVMGRRFWSYVVPFQYVTRMNESSSLMSITTHSFTSATNRTFEIYKNGEKIPGIVRETISVKLFSVEEAEDTW